MIVREIGRGIINKIAVIIGPENTLKAEAKIRFKKEINLNSPKTLSDKICYLELRSNNPLKEICSDKYDVRSYIRSKGMEELLIPLIGGAYGKIEDISFDDLPSKFVLKATYGCQMNFICNDKESLDIKKCKKVMKRWLSKGFNRDVLEPHYKNIKRRIICEQYLESTDSILDYKIHCFNGKPEFILVCSERNAGLKLNLYDLDWNPVPGICGRHINDKEIQRPSQLEFMLQVAEKLSVEFDFVRVDLYQIDKKVYFGELTFTPDGGMLSYFTKEFDAAMGDKLQINI